MVHPAPGRLEGKVAIVTGGAHGLGRAYAHEGAKIAIADLDLAAAEEVARGIESDGGAAIAVETDVSSEESTLRMARETAGRFGTGDIPS